MVRSEEGRLVAVKLARDEAEAERLDREAAALAAIAHPGVVRLVRHVPGVELTTGRVGERSLADQPAPTVRAALARVAAVAAVTADLHAAGLVHGAIEPSHVLLAGDGRPVLCGFSLAGPVTEPFPADTVDPAHPAGSPRRPAADVFALGRLLQRELASVPARGVGDRRLLRGAERLVREATDPEPARRPTAGATAAALARLAGDARPPVRRHRPAVVRTWSTPHRSGPGRSPRTALLAAIAAVSVAVAVVLPAAQPDDPTTADPTAAATAAAATADSAAAATADSAAAAPPSDPVASTPAPPQPPPAPPPPPATSPPPDVAAPTEAGGPGPELDDGGARYRAGVAGDLVAVGDWDCDGEATVALLRPSTGGVFLFDGWAPDGGSVTTPEATRLPGATALRAVPDGTGCDALELATPEGARRIAVARPGADGRPGAPG